MLNGLDLFSGIGGLTLALNEWVRPVAYCEIDPYCQGVLLSRITSGQLPNAPIWDDIKTLDGFRFPRGYVDVIFGGFPCQDISIARLGKGLEGERSGLFFEILRLAKEIKPSFIFLENVPAITSRGGLQVVREIAEMGYDCRWCIISAASVGALHKRERWFLLAHSLRERCENREKVSQKQPAQEPALRENRNRERIRLWQETVSSMDRTTNGIPYRVDRVKALGNAVVPAQCKKAFKILMGLNNEERKKQALFT
jgi:DNA (cytosine-5)-methyltransferase 1